MKQTRGTLSRLLKSIAREVYSSNVIRLSLRIFSFISSWWQIKISSLKKSITYNN